jgi:hypothetical protein
MKRNCSKQGSIIIVNHNCCYTVSETPSLSILWHKSNLIQYKKVVVLGEDNNNLASNAATWHKWGYLMSKKIETELNAYATEPKKCLTEPVDNFCETKVIF